ncbi:MAG: hypothetical protein ABSD20_00035 [Terriglobales bacterium]|jgi:hypothetical protein
MKTTNKVLSITILVAALLVVVTAEGTSKNALGFHRIARETPTARPAAPRRASPLIHLMQATIPANHAAEIEGKTKDADISNFYKN